MRTPSWPTPNYVPTNARRSPPPLLDRANARFTECGITVRKVSTDNGPCYRPHVFADALSDVEHRRTRPYLPQINGQHTERCQEFTTWLRSPRKVTGGYAARVAASVTVDRRWG